MRVHELKSWPISFQAVKEGDKLAEFRRADRGFEVGDVLLLREYVPAVADYGEEAKDYREDEPGYTGETCLVQILHIGAECIPLGFVLLSVVPVKLVVDGHA
jgi:hypothetical protein